MIALTGQRRGFTIVEVLMSLAVAAILMVAVGSAMFASASSFKSNTDYVQATQTARNAVQMISTAARTSYACDVAGLSVGNTTTGGVLYVTQFDGAGTGAGTKIAYVYDQANKRLLLDTTPASTPITDLEAALPGIRSRMAGVSPTVFLLAEKVNAASFVGKYAQRWYEQFADPVSRCVDVRVNVKMGIGNEVLDLSDSVVPRTAYDQ